MISYNEQPKSLDELWTTSEGDLPDWTNNEEPPNHMTETNTIMVLNYTSIHNKHWEDYKCGKY